jgi:hypothetical protein
MKLSNSEGLVVVMGDADPFIPVIYTNNSSHDNLMAAKVTKSL